MNFSDEDLQINQLTGIIVDAYLNEQCAKLNHKYNYCVECKHQESLSLIPPSKRRKRWEK